MGKVVIISTEHIRPSQDYLKESTLRQIFKHIQKGETGKLPPLPIVRYDPTTKTYVAIDGHNLIAVHDFLGKDIRVYIADSATDVLASNKGKQSLIEGRNEELGIKFEESLNKARSLAAAGIASFKDLRRRYAGVIG